MPFKTTFFFALVCSQALMGQTVDTLEANHYWSTGSQFYQDQEYDSAAFHFRAAFKIFEEYHFTEREGDCLLQEGNCFLRKRNHEEAIKIFKQSVARYSEVFPEDHIKFARPLNNMGRIYFEQGELFTSKEYLEKAASIRINNLPEDHLHIGVSYYNLGTNSMHFGDYSQAMTHYLKALPIYLKHYGEAHRSISSLYVNMGILYDKMGDVRHAIDYYQKANEIDIKKYGESYWLLAYNYINLGISYFNMEADSLAQVYFEKTIVLGEANELHELYATAYYELGNLQVRKQNHEEALQLFQQAINIISDHLGSNHHQLNHFYAAIASTKKMQAKYAEAEDYMKSAIDNVKSNFGEIHPSMGNNYQKLAALYRVQGKYAAVHEAIDRGIAAVTPNKIQPEISHVSFDDLLDLDIFLNLLKEKTAVLEAEYEDEATPGNIQLLYTALDYYQMINALIDHMRRGYMAEESKVLLQNEAVGVYESAIHLCKKLYNITDSVHYLETAFQFSEKNKATVLAETLQAEDLTQLQGIPQETLKEEKTLKQKIAFTEQKLIDHPTDTVIAKEVFYVKWQYDSLAKSIANKYPQYYDLKYNLEVISIAELQQFLTEESAALSYFEGDSSWYVFSVSKDKVALTEVPNDSLLNHELNIFREGVSNPLAEITSFASAAYHIYQQLIAAPLLNHPTIQNIIIIPDGMLGYTPFDALITQPTEDKIPRPRYLIEDYTISYANSATLLSQSQKRAIEPQISYAGFAPTYPENLIASNEGLMNFRDLLAQLSGTQEEVSFAGKIFSGITFLEQQATEFNFKHLEKSPAILHLAMHALVDDKNPMQSRLLFTEASDSVDDARLHAYEVYNLKLSSNLAVLSACNTGYGEIHRGEGIMSLSRAFMYAGCPSIVMSLWRAKDQPTTKIISDFFTNLNQGESKEKALRQAKLNYLQKADPLQAHPANWATFVLLGNTDPVQTFSTARMWWMAGLLFFVFSTATFFYFRKKKTTVASN